MSEEVHLFKCPLCCNEIFNSFESLKIHLLDVSKRLKCHICNTNFESVIYYVQHLEECLRLNAINSEVGEDEIQEHNTEEEMQHNTIGDEEENDMILNEKNILNSTINMKNSIMNIQIVKDDDMDKQLPIGTQQLTMAAGQNNILLVNSGEQSGLLSNQNVITRQNEDGTISFTTVNDEEIIGSSVSSDVVDSIVGNNELYNCNTCGISFSSIIQHIQIYHNDQDVVVQVAEMIDDKYEEETPLNDEVSLLHTIINSGDQQQQHYQHNDQQQTTTEQQDEQIYIKPNEESSNDRQPMMLEQQIMDKEGRIYTRRYVQIDKFWASNGVIKEENNKSKDTSQSDNMDTISSISCPICSKQLKNSKSYFAHIRNHKNKDNKQSKPSEEEKRGPFKCMVCDTLLPTNKSLQLHKRMHAPVKNRSVDAPVGFDPGLNDKYLCEICNKYIHVAYRDIHSDYHEGLAEFVCNMCNKRFFSAALLLLHMNVHKETSQSQTLVVNNDHGNKILKYSCSFCNKMFARPHEKVKHERIHTGEKPHACELCGKTFRVSYCLTLHMRTHTGAKPFTCNVCGKKFTAQSGYNHHLQTHSNVRAYKCPYCPKSFKTAVQLGGHKKSHTKPFLCTECNRPFASLYSVRVHMETHKRTVSGLRFSCSSCGASYARAFALNDHIKSAHPEEADKELVSVVQYKEGSENTINENIKCSNSKDVDKELANGIQFKESTENTVSKIKWGGVKDEDQSNCEIICEPPEIILPH